MHPLRTVPEPQPHEPLNPPPLNQEESTDTTDQPPYVPNEWSPFRWKPLDPAPKTKRKTDYLCRPS
jgi:hypothetical protein